MVLQQTNIFALTIIKEINLSKIFFKDISCNYLIKIAKVVNERIITKDDQHFVLIKIARLLYL